MHSSGNDRNEFLADRLESARVSGVLRYALAIVSVGVALGAGLFLQYFNFRVPPALLLFAVAVSSWYGRLGPAVLAAVLATISFFAFFIEPVRSISIQRSDIPLFIIFVVFSAFLAWFGVVRRRIEAGLREQAQLLNLTHDTVFVMDMQGVIKYWNCGAAEQYGWTAEQALGKVVHDLLKTVFPKPLAEIKAELLLTGRWEAELVHTRKDGIQIVVASRWALQRDQKGSPIAILETNHDITERKRAEEARRLTEAYLRESQQLSHTGSFAFEVASNKYVYVSEECFRIFEVDSKEYPTREAVSRLIHPEDWDRVQGDLEKLLRVKVDIPSEFRIVLPSGAIKEVQVIRHAILNEAGEAVTIVGTVIDITERKRAEQERERLRQLEADLAHINRVSMMGELVASIAHEINQPISGVASNGSACLRWLARDVPNLDEAREAARRIVRDGKRAGEIIARARALTRKRTAARLEKLDLSHTIQEVLALTVDEANKSGVNIRTEFADELAPVSGDRVQLQQVMLNLIMNAIEAMSSVDEGTRELVIVTRNIDMDQVQVTIRDSGVGIDPEMIDKIFESFYTTKPGGMGMGLSISRSIIQSHGGRLWATANDGPGTTFHFTVSKYHEEQANAAVAGM